MTNIFPTNHFKFNNISDTDKMTSRSSEGDYGSESEHHRHNHSKAPHPVNNVDDYAFTQSLFDHYHIKPHVMNHVQTKADINTGLNHDSGNYEFDSGRSGFDDNYSSNHSFNSSGFSSGKPDENLTNMNYFEYNTSTPSTGYDAHPRRSIHVLERASQNPVIQEPNSNRNSIPSSSANINPNANHNDHLSEDEVVRPTSHPVGMEKSSRESTSKSDTLSNEEFNTYFDFTNSDFQDYNNNHNVDHIEEYKRRVNIENPVAEKLINKPAEVTPKSDDVKSSKRSKNPGFHIPLDNINSNPMASNKFSAFISSSHSDSNFHNYFDAPPTFESDFEVINNNNPNSVITPSMNPAISDAHGYFGLSATPTILAQKKETSPSNDLDNSTVDRQLYESYLLANELNSAGDATGERFHPDLRGFNFDVNPRSEPPEREESFKPLAFEPLNPSTTFEELEKEGNESDRDKSKVLYLNLTRPGFQRENSNQSLSSVGSAPGSKDKPKKKKAPKGAICSVCDKYISRDLTRHMRIHNDVGRFQCVYPKFMCNHKTQYFNRPYDYKKHLLHMHFKFDDPRGKTANTLTDKLPMMGTCQACGARFMANDWLDLHVLTNDSSKKCSFVESK
ncbi:uncharacterized protein PRCAT00001912001 [Priceomyces carsonii]|uniref:uncharacterized protein n=1 Tax=Priceomyces carsonii TaxID=28549 RepID=UPI002ED9BA01|nr:unnamed protein product [Priceomyces carsonii]